MLSPKIRRGRRWFDTADHARLRWSGPCSSGTSIQVQTSARKLPVLIFIHSQCSTLWTDALVSVSACSPQVRWSTKESNLGRINMPEGATNKTTEFHENMISKEGNHSMSHPTSCPSNFAPSWMPHQCQRQGDLHKRAPDACLTSSSPGPIIVS
jgi:hypothetical protein